MKNMPYSTHDEYFATVPPDMRVLLTQVQAKVEQVVPEAERCISYNMPAYRVGKTFFYFASFKRHIGIYPPITYDAPLIAELQPYRGPKGNLSFPSDKPLPLELIGRVAVALAKEYRAKTRFDDDA